MCFISLPMRPPIQFQRLFVTPTRFSEGDFGITRTWCNWLNHFHPLASGVPGTATWSASWPSYINPPSDPDNPLGCGATQAQFTSDHLVTGSPKSSSTGAICSCVLLKELKVGASLALAKPPFANHRHPEMLCNLAVHVCWACFAFSVNTSQYSECKLNFTGATTLAIYCSGFCNCLMLLIPQDYFGVFFKNLKKKKKLLQLSCKKRSWCFLHNILG